MVIQRENSSCVRPCCTGSKENHSEDLVRYFFRSKLLCVNSKMLLMMSTCTDAVGWPYVTVAAIRPSCKCLPCFWKVSRNIRWGGKDRKRAAKNDCVCVCVCLCITINTFNCKIAWMSCFRKGRTRSQCFNARTNAEWFANDHFVVNPLLCKRNLKMWRLCVLPLDFSTIKADFLAAYWPCAISKSNLHLLAAPLWIRHRIGANIKIPSQRNHAEVPKDNNVIIWCHFRREWTKCLQPMTGQTLKKSLTW